MHYADACLQKLEKAKVHAVLSGAEGAKLQTALDLDSGDFFQAGAVSFIDAIRAIDQGFYSWATVKLYYSVFYALRARLAIAGDCIFYVGPTPHHIAAIAGGAATKKSGTTHKVVTSVFNSKYQTDYFLSQEVEGLPSLEWLTNKREDANYRMGRFCEPEVPQHFKAFKQDTARKMLTAYSSDSLYTFDADHAMIAYPFALMSDLRKRAALKNISLLLAPELKFLKVASRDLSGEIVALSQILS